jgi:hypothetical protein
MFKAQREDFRIQFNRIQAETDQVKALLGVKLTNNRGFVEAGLCALVCLLAGMCDACGRWMGGG